MNIKLIYLIIRIIIASVIAYFVHQEAGTFTTIFVLLAYLSAEYRQHRLELLITELERLRNSVRMTRESTLYTQREIQKDIEMIERLIRNKLNSN